MNKIAEKYIAGLRQAYFDIGEQTTWEHFEKIKHGTSADDLKKLKAAFPDVSEALISLLEFADGTYWREYAGEQISLYFFGSDVEEYPYYLLSASEIVQNQNNAANHFAEYIERKYDGVGIDQKIISNAAELKWLHFSDCMNNGGTSQLFIDFSPSTKGMKGQVVRFLHDPDSLLVIADSFEDYLTALINDRYSFISEDF